jgi:signal peptidase I
MKGWLKALLWIAGILGVLFLVLRIWFIDFQRIGADRNDPRNWANAPNLEPGDFALVWRSGTPHTGEIVRCVDPTDTSRWLVARVIAISGERVEMIDGVLLINNFRVRLGACSAGPRKIMGADGIETEFPCQSEELGGSKHDIYGPGSGVQMAPLVVEAGKIFLLSDNRSEPFAHDSRELGTMPVEACTQRLVVRMWSQKGWGDSERRMSFLF